MENQQLVSPSRKYSSTPVAFGEGFLKKSNVTTVEYPHTFLIWLQLIFSFSLD
jgi:hypothetical protein